jgi:RNA polymerase sigma-70 factor (ECF subfamily)
LASDSDPGGNPLFRDNDGVDPHAPGASRVPPALREAVRAEPDEAELVASVLRKDRKAAARFVAAHIDAVYAYARHRLTPRVELVDDVVQDVFLAALDSLAAFQGQSSLRAWLLGIARHKVEDVYRRRLRVAEPLDTLQADGDDRLRTAPAIEERLDAARARDRARHVLSRIPERYGLVLLWRYWEQRSVRDIAAAIGATEKGVERTLARARARFKEQWLKEERHG